MTKRTFAYTAIVDRNVTDEIDIKIEANTELEALAKVRRVVEVFPEDHGEEGVPFCLIVKRRYRNSELMSLSEQEDKGAKD